MACPPENNSPEIEDSKTNLHGVVSLQKRDPPLTATDLHRKLSLLWKDTVTSWKLISLGKNYFEFQFSSVEEMRQIAATSGIDLKPGILRFFQWSKNFNPNTHAQIWVRFRRFPQEYWTPAILFAIASGFGTPLDMDENTKDKYSRTFGHYARLLVDVDMSKMLYKSILVQREGFAFDLKVAFEKLPHYCNMCMQIGHKDVHCKKQKAKIRVDSKENQSRVVKHVSKEEIRPNGVRLEAVPVEEERQFEPTN